MDNKDKSIEQLESEKTQKYEEMMKALKEPSDEIKATNYAYEIQRLFQEIMRRKHNRT